MLMLMKINLNTEHSSESACFTLAEAVVVEPSEFEESIFYSLIQQSENPSKALSSLIH